MKEEIIKSFTRESNPQIVVETVVFGMESSVLEYVRLFTLGLLLT